MKPPRTQQVSVVLLIAGIGLMLLYRLLGAFVQGSMGSATVPIVLLASGLVLSLIGRLQTSPGALTPTQMKRVRFTAGVTLGIVTVGVFAVVLVAEFLQEPPELQVDIDLCPAAESPDEPEHLYTLDGRVEGCSNVGCPLVVETSGIPVPVSRLAGEAWVPDGDGAYLVRPFAISDMALIPGRPAEDVAKIALLQPLCAIHADAALDADGPAKGVRFPVTVYVTEQTPLATEDVAMIGAWQRCVDDCTAEHIDPCFEACFEAAEQGNTAPMERGCLSCPSLSHCTVPCSEEFPGVQTTDH